MNPVVAPARVISLQKSPSLRPSGCSSIKHPGFGKVLNFRELCVGLVAIETNGRQEAAVREDVAHGNAANAGPGRSAAREGSEGQRQMLKFLPM